MKKLVISLIIMLVALSATAQKVFDVNLWPGQAPNSNGNPNDTARVRVFLPDSKKATGRAIVICPGGGYTHLALEKEGYNWSGFFNNMGIAVIVLKYRMPNGNPDVPISDAEQAMRLVRRNAASWHINTSNVGIMGSSAGGHLASYIAVNSKGEAKPDFQILFYPVITMMEGYCHRGSHDALLGKNPGKKRDREYSNDMHVSRVTPRAFIALCDDDEVVLPANGVNYYTELYRHDVPGALYVYPKGGHGWGATIGFVHNIEMQMNLKGWLESF